MKNLSPYSGDPFDFHKDVVKSKRITTKDPTYKTRLGALEPDLEKCYMDYSKMFASNTLEHVVAHGYLGIDKKDLEELYNYRCKPISVLCVSLTTKSDNVRDDTCPYCTINSVNSMDHYLPQSSFPEFSVNPQNLVPCCSECNGHKSSVWIKSAKRVALNLYTDVLPNEQYLAVIVSSSHGIVDVNFHLVKPKGIPCQTWDIIQHHYNSLDLCNRFKGRSSKVVGEVDNQFRTYRPKLSIADIVSVIHKQCVVERMKYGINFWEAVLKESLISSSSFLSQY